MIRVQREPFDTGAELTALKAGKSNIGGTVVFLGTVRDISGGGASGQEPRLALEY